MVDKVNIGIIGCGNISHIYFKGAQTFNNLTLVGCADLDHARAQAKAEEHGGQAMTVDELLQHPDVEIIVNLTVPGAHAEINLKALEHGKHVHCEKPFGINREGGREVLALAERKNLLVGSAPDTFLGGGLQTCRKLIDDGWIGRPVAATAFMACHGHESWHPHPEFYYQPGGGPLFDMGPYYLTALVMLLGPVKRVTACTGMAFTERVATSEARKGDCMPVTVPTHLAGTLEFANGAIVSVIMSFDIWTHTLPRIEVHGTLGSLQCPDPNCFGGPVNASAPGGFTEIPLTHGYTENSRGIGVADMARAIRTGRPHRCNGQLAFHVLDVMCAFEESADSGTHIAIQSTCERPAPMQRGLIEGELD